MDIVDLKEASQALSERIEYLINEFEGNTDTVVSCVNLNRISISKVGCKPETILNVDLKIELL